MTIKSTYIIFMIVLLINKYFSGHEIIFHIDNHSTSKQEAIVSMKSTIGKQNTLGYQLVILNIHSFDNVIECFILRKFQYIIIT